MTISGQLVVCNRLTQHLEVKLASSERSGGGGGREAAPTALPALQTAPSYVLEHHASRAIKVRVCVCVCVCAKKSACVLTTLKCACACACKRVKSWVDVVSVGVSLVLVCASRKPGASQRRFPGLRRW